MDETEMIIDMVYVKPEKRRQGKGTELIKTAINYAREKGYKTIGLWAEPQEKDGISKSELIAFYEKLGFVRGNDADEDMTYTL